MRSEDRLGSIATFVVNAPVGDDLSVGPGGEEISATGPDVTFFCVCWDDGGGTNCNSATAAARFAGQSEFLIWTGE